MRGAYSLRCSRRTMCCVVRSITRRLRELVEDFLRRAVRDGGRERDACGLGGARQSVHDFLHLDLELGRPVGERVRDAVHHGLADVDAEPVEDIRVGLDPRGAALHAALDKGIDLVRVRSERDVLIRGDVRLRLLHVLIRVPRLLAHVRERGGGGEDRNGGDVPRGGDALEAGDDLAPAASALRHRGLSGDCGLGHLIVRGGDSAQCERKLACNDLLAHHRSSERARRSGGCHVRLDHGRSHACNCARGYGLRSEDRGVCGGDEGPCLLGSLDGDVDRGESDERADENLDRSLVCVHLLEQSGKDGKDHADHARGNLLELLEKLHPRGLVGGGLRHALRAHLDLLHHVRLPGQESVRLCDLLRHRLLRRPEDEASLAELRESVRRVFKRASVSLGDDLALLVRERGCVEHRLREARLVGHVVEAHREREDALDFRA